MQSLAAAISSSPSSRSAANLGAPFFAARYGLDHGICQLNAQATFSASSVIAAEKEITAATLKAKASHANRNNQFICAIASPRHCLAHNATLPTVRWPVAPTSAGSGYEERRYVSPAVIRHCDHPAAGL